MGTYGMNQRKNI